MVETFSTQEHAPIALRRQRAKIAVIGGGSPYCAGLMRSLAHDAETFKGCHITLMDINEDGLELIYTLGSKFFRQAGADITLERTTNRTAALSDADFVVTAFRTGGMQARRLDEQIPLRHGLIGQETVGPGGFFYALRTVPVVAEIAAEMERVAPQAFLLNYTNPSNIVTEAVAHCSNVRLIGMCDGPVHEIPGSAEQAGIAVEPGKRLHYRTVGLNHGNWTTAVWRDGVDMLPQIVAWCRDYIGAHPEMTPENYQEVMHITLTARYGAIPSHYLHYYYFPERVLHFLQNKATSRAEDILALLPDILAHYREEAQKEVPHLVKMRGSGGFGDFVLDILRSILHDTGEEWVLNVPNKGAINFLPSDRVVELPCRVDARGASPLAQGDGGIALDQRGLITLLAEYEGAAARAALWGSRQDAIKALAANPLVMSYSKAEAVYDDLAAAHAAYLPGRLTH
ncbi:MAG: glycoside hydrolase [Chloroflexota bacterium]|nr:glycoside hydrolase [Chloroflexota bacterium]